MIMLRRYNVKFRWNVLFGFGWIVSKPQLVTDNLGDNAVYLISMKIAILNLLIDITEVHPSEYDNTILTDDHLIYNVT